MPVQPTSRTRWVKEVLWNSCAAAVLGEAGATLTAMRTCGRRATIRSRQEILAQAGLLTEHERLRLRLTRVPDKASRTRKLFYPPEMYIAESEWRDAK
eukprot:7377628-Prymnesium_polylepis.2